MFGSPILTSIAVTSTYSHITITNGMIGGFAIGISLGDQSRVEKVQVSNSTCGIELGGSATAIGNTVVGTTNRSCGGILVGDYSTITNNVTNNNAGFGISAGDGSTVIGNAAAGNSDGVIVDPDCTVINNAVNENAEFGMVFSSGGTVIGNAAGGNGKYGLRFSDNTSGYVNNTLRNNNGGGAQVSGGTQIGMNLCNGKLCQ
jgi:hypothetical protein